MYYVRVARLLDPKKGTPKWLWRSSSLPKITSVIPGDVPPASGLGLGVPGRHGGAVPPPGGHQSAPAALRSWAIPTLGEWALRPSPKPAIFAAALILCTAFPGERCAR